MLTMLEGVIRSGTGGRLGWAYNMQNVEVGGKTVIFCLNDNAADGRDISWIWDADIQADGKIYAAGKRSGDMALRLKYSGMDAEITDDVLQTVLRCKGDVFVVPTYTAMMAMRPKFAEHFGKEAFWK